MIIPETVTPKELADEMGWPERWVRETARSLGACLGKTRGMRLTGADVLRIMEAKRCSGSTCAAGHGIAAAADIVCHEEQLRIWAEEITGALSMAGYIREDMSYEDVIDIGKVVEREIKSIVKMAFAHPEARTIRRQS